MSMNRSDIAREERALIEKVLKREDVGRRRLFEVAAWSVAGAAAATAVPATQAAAQQAAAPARRILQKDDSRLLNIGATVRSGQYWNFSTWITPVEEFYVRNHYPTPTAEQKPELDPRNWKLRIHGNAVERELTLTYEDLLKLPSRTLFATMECHGNCRTLFWEQQDMKDVSGGNWVMGAIGLAEWEYVPLSEILARVGLKPGAKALLFWSGVDGGGDIGRPVPMREVLSRPDDIGLAFKMNGNPLLPDHGAPVRALVPGWGGAASIKWLTEIKIADHDFWVRLNTKGEVFVGPDYPRPSFSERDEFRNVTPDDIKGPMVEWMPVKSTLTVPLVIEKSPSFPVNYPIKKGELPTLPAGPRVMRGYAWGPQFGVRKVEYRINGGPWREAHIRQPNLGRYTWVRFDFPWDAPPGEHVIETRATDNAGNTQPPSVPFNLYGMANNAIPRFRIRVVA
ncbi:MAG: molybdopterin-dependent oxidoreductase [Elioraea sp.]|nr:molybdopterin-dependent oxidoreductase [Elioraea sp.]